MENSKKRLSFALWPDEDCRRTIVERTQGPAQTSRGRPDKPENFHITLAFLHLVEASVIPCIAAAAERAAGKPFNVELSKVGHWQRSRILWLAPSGSDDGQTGAADALAGALWRELAVCGFHPEQRRFQPHVTLARKAGAPPHPNRIVPIDWFVNSFVLVQSITGRRESEYIVLQKYVLSDNKHNSKKFNDSKT